MRLIDERSGVEILPRELCLVLLEREEVGRLAVIDGLHPRIFPVNYAMDGDTVVLRSAPGTKMTFGTRSPVCFEIDHFDRTAREGWSVVVDGGNLQEVTSFNSPEEVRRTLGSSIESWAPGPKDHWLRLTPLQITGRRLLAPDRAQERPESKR